MVAAPLVKDSTHRLAVLGTSVTQNPVLKGYAEKDLGIVLDMVTLGGESAQQRAALSPQSYDVYDQWFHDIDLSWPTGSLQPIDINRIKGFRQLDLNALTGYSKTKDHIWKTSAPIDRLFVGAELSLSRKPSEQISMMPTIFNADTMAIINGQSHPFPHVNDWQGLLDEDWHGAVIIQKDSAISMVEILLALIQKGDLDVADITDLTTDEIDQFIRCFSGYLKKGQILHHWEVEYDLLAITHINKPLLCSIWWSGAMQLRGRGYDVSMFTPKSGYRGWFGGLALSRSLSDWNRDAAYDYLNWWLTGPAGAYL
ncbi:MAG TPA: ABC transporter, partial [Alphaproteobacteria bacterium]|nr:ABC transporter [Alphaproteobacteria bacterium]